MYLYSHMWKGQDKIKNKKFKDNLGGKLYFGAHLILFTSYYTVKNV